MLGCLFAFANNMYSQFLQRYKGDKHRTQGVGWLVISLSVISVDSLAAGDVNKPRLITLAPHIVEMIFELGAGDQIVGTTEHSDFPAQALQIPRIGNYAAIQIERVLELQPDYVLAWKTGNPNEDLQRLEKLGFKIVYSDPKQLEDVAKELLLFGALVGKPERGEKLALAFKQRLTAIKTQYQQQPPISVFYELWSRPLTTVANNAWPQQQLAVCGAENPFVDLENDYPQISIEQVVAYDPQVIIQPDSENQSNRDLIDWRRWQALQAIKNGAVLSVNADILHRMTSRMLNGLEQLCRDLSKVRQQYIVIKTNNN